MAENRKYARSSEAGASVATDLSRDDVYISGTVLNATAFAAMFRTLGKIAKQNTNQSWVDHSAYQNWVVQQYLKELTETERRDFVNHEKLTEKLSGIEKRLGELRERLLKLSDQLGLNSANRRRFYDWLYSYDREAWLVLDPLITVTREGVYFECFSNDESAYARLSMPITTLSTPEAIRPGTTNIDYSLPLDRELARVRSYRPLHLRIGTAGLTAATSHSEVVERPIDLPESWVAGFAEVSAAQSLSDTRLTVSSRLIANVLAVLSQRKDVGKGRGLIFHLTPGEPIEVELQPWGLKFQDHMFTYTGTKSTSITVYGRRRLMVLRDLLSHIETVEVSLLGDALPTYWTVRNGELTLTLGFSGWNRLDWSSKTRLSELVSQFDLNSLGAREAIEKFIELRSCSVSQLVASAETSLSEAEGLLLLRTLMFRGRAILDSDSGNYVFREIAPGVDIQRRTTVEERIADDLLSKKLIAIFSETNAENGRTVVGAVKDARRAKPVIKYDTSGLIAQLTCTCPAFNLRQKANAPCRHIIALNRLVVKNAI